MKKSIFFLVSFILVSCHSTKVEDSSADIDESFRSTTRAMSEATTPALGFGYSVEGDYTNHNKCVSGYEFDLGPAREAVTFTANQSTDMIRTLVSGSLDTSVDFGGFSLDAGGMLERSNYDTENSINFSFIYRYVSKYEVLMSYDLESPKNDANFSLSGCPAKINYTADEFVNSREIGGLLKFDIVISSDYANQANAMAGYLRVGPSGLYFDVEGARSDGAVLENVAILMEFKQLGGKPEELPKVLGGNVAGCTGSNFQACLDIYKRALNYAFDDFSDQIDESEDNQYILSYTTIPYSHAGILGIEKPSGINEYKQLAVLKYLRSAYDRKMSELNELVNSHASSAKVTAIEAEIDSLSVEYYRCQSSYDSCFDASII